MGFNSGFKGLIYTSISRLVLFNPGKKRGRYILKRVLCGIQSRSERFMENRKTSLPCRYLRPCSSDQQPNHSAGSASPPAHSRRLLVCIDVKKPETEEKIINILFDLLHRGKTIIVTFLHTCSEQTNSYW